MGQAGVVLGQAGPLLAGMARCFCVPSQEVRAVVLCSPFGVVASSLESIFKIRSPCVILLLFEGCLVDARSQ